MAKIIKKFRVAGFGFKEIRNLEYRGQDSVAGKKKNYLFVLKIELLK